MTSLTLTVVSLVDFLLDSILEGVCFLLHRKVQPDLTILHYLRNEQGITLNKNSTLNMCDPLIQIIAGHHIIT